jgi:hypothetical protein
VKRWSFVARVILVLVGAFAFGVLAAWAKGQNTGGAAYPSQLRGVIGNLSTPWLLVPFFAGVQCTRLRQGSVVGLAATLCALAGFYLLSTLVQSLGGHGFLDDLRIELTGNRAYFEGGIVTGPIFGALGRLVASTGACAGGSARRCAADRRAGRDGGTWSSPTACVSARVPAHRADHSRLGTDRRLRRCRMGGLHQRVDARSRGDGDRHGPTKSAPQPAAHLSFVAQPCGLHPADEEWVASRVGIHLLPLGAFQVAGFEQAGTETHRLFIRPLRVVDVEVHVHLLGRSVWPVGGNVAVRAERRSSTHRAR